MVRPIEYRKYNQIKFYYGIVVDVDEQFNIHFRIPDIIDNLDTYPIAHPITKHTSQIFKNDNVLIMQLDVDLQEFVYFPNEVTTWTGIRYKNCIIELAAGDDPDTMNLEIVELEDAKDDDHEPEDIKNILTQVQINKNKIRIGVDSNGKDDSGANPSTEAKTYVELAKADLGNTITLSTKNDSSTNTIEMAPDKTTVTTGSNQKVTIDDQAKKIEIVDNTNNSITIDGDAGKIEVKCTNKVITVDGNQGITLDDGMQNVSQISASGIKDSTMLQSKMSLGALVGLDNAAGGLSSMISDIWTEMLTLATNLVALAAACAAIQYVGPGALTNGTSAAVGAASSSLGTIAAKMAMSKAISGPAT